MMDIYELQQMVSSIGQKMSNCRGNLRLKVLLKSTYVYIKSNLLTYHLENSGILQTSTMCAETNHSLACNEGQYSKILDIDQENDQSVVEMAWNECEKSSDPNYENVNQIFSKSSHKPVNPKNRKVIDLKLQKLMYKWLKEFNRCSAADSCRTQSLDHKVNRQRLKVIKNLLEECQVYMEMDSKNNDFKKQSLKTRRIVVKLQEHCKDLVEAEDSRENMTAEYKKYQHKLKKTTQKLLKKYDTYMKSGCDFKDKNEFKKDRNIPKKFSNKMWTEFTDTYDKTGKSSKRHKNVPNRESRKNRSKQSEGPTSFGNNRYSSHLWTKCSAFEEMYDRVLKIEKRHPRSTKAPKDDYSERRKSENFSFSHSKQHKAKKLLDSKKYRKERTYCRTDVGGSRKKSKWQGKERKVR